MILGAFGSLQVLAEGSPDEVFTQVSDIFKNLPKLKSTSLHGYDVTFITGEARKGVLFINFLVIRAYVVPAAKKKSKYLKDIPTEMAKTILDLV